MSKIRIKSIKIKNYRSFGAIQEFVFPTEDYKKPVAIVGYNNSGKTNLMNAILYSTGQKFVSENTFIKTDLHKLDLANLIEITTDIDASSYTGTSWRGEPENKSIKGEHKLSVNLEDNELKASIKPSFFGTSKHYQCFYINFHNIKEEISTKKTSWGNLTSFLAKHIKNIIDTDLSMKEKEEAYKNETKAATNKVLQNSELDKFIATVKINYSKNLRDNNCEVEFGLPDYEDIFLHMMFKIGLNGNTENLIPIDHFGDGYISMFVMAVIQAIAESNSEDKCLFLFEEPESFLHENHQEYFYKMVLCSLAEQGHQVIYTTHSAKMVDIFDTKSIIRIEFDETTKQTVRKYNNIETFSPTIDIPIEENTEPITIENYNSFIKSVEPNLNKILFSRKVILVEGPNDLMSYNFAIEQKVNAIINDAKYAKSYLNFLNIAIVTHHGKATALLLIKLCKHFGLDFFVINDWDFEHDYVNQLASVWGIEELQVSDLYLKDGQDNRSAVTKGMITTNWKLLDSAGINNIHFNIPRLEKVLGYESDDKDSLSIWQLLNKIESFPDSFFPVKLQKFIELDVLENDETLEFQQEAEESPDAVDTLPF